jgi:hypothetical protein
MSKYKMDDNTIVDTKKATQHWEEKTDWNGNNHISRVTGSQWEHEELYRSSKGRYYVERNSQIQGQTPYAVYVTGEQAAIWLLVNEYELPPELQEHEGEIVE